MQPARQGKKWLRAEEDQLLEELRGEDRLGDIAARHQRSVGAICARIEHLLVPDRVFDSDAALIDWAKSVARSPQFVRPVSSPPVRTVVDVERPSRAPEADPARREAVLAIRTALTAGTGREVAAPDVGELDVLASFDDGRLEEAGRAVVKRRGPLGLADWVLECDSPGIADIRLTADQLGTGGEAEKSAGAQLVRAGLARLWQRNREILLMRLGLLTGATTMAEIAQQFGLTRERIRQIQNRELDRALVTAGSGVRRGWHEARDRLRRLLIPDGQSACDPELVLIFVELVMPHAPREVAVTVVGRLSGGKAATCRELVTAVETCHHEREQRNRLAAEEERQRIRASEQRSRRTAKVLRLIDEAEWPPTTSIPAGGAPTPVRSPGQRPHWSNPRRWWAPRLGREVGCESEAELHVVQLLDAADDWS